VPIGDETLKEITEVVRKAGVNLEGEESEGTEDKGLGGWDGGVVWLVPTDKPITEWKPIATREL
jgi:2',3'-cyclic-nucleotide 3'-phosphodiesterase